MAQAGAQIGEELDRGRNSRRGTAAGGMARKPGLPGERAAFPVEEAAGVRRRHPIGKRQDAAGRFSGCQRGGTPAHVGAHPAGVEGDDDDPIAPEYRGRGSG